MTTEEALKIDPARYSVHGDVATALRVLADALREAQAQTVQMREAMVPRRAGAGHICGGPACRVCDANESALPAPAARTYDDGVRDAAKAARAHARLWDGPEAGEAADSVANVVERLLSPAPAVAPVAQKTVRTSTCCLGPMIPPGGCAFDTNGTCDRPKWTDAVAPVAVPKPRVIVAPPIDFSEEDAPDEKPVAFDAEAALVAMEQSIARRQHGPTPATRYEVYTAIQDALAAGRGAR